MNPLKCDSNCINCGLHRREHCELCPYDELQNWNVDMCGGDCSTSWWCTDGGFGCPEIEQRCTLNQDKVTDNKDADNDSGGDRRLNLLRGGA